MRRISIQRSKGKVRGVPRRLRDVERWADRFEGFFPTEFIRDYPTEGVVDFHLPVLDRLVNAPTAKRKSQRVALQCLLRAADHLIRAKPDDLNEARVIPHTVYPEMFNSEISVIFNPEYVRIFLDRQDNEYETYTLLPAARSLTARLGVDLPSALTEKGYDWRMKNTDDGETWWEYRAELWLYQEPPRPGQEIP